VFNGEAELCRVERDRTTHVFHLISNAMHAVYEGMSSEPLLLSRLSGIRHIRHLSSPITVSRVAVSIHALTERIKRVDKVQSISESDYENR